jgi:chromosome segregation ATPase
LLAGENAYSSSKYGNKITIQRTISVTEGAGGKQSSTSKYQLFGADSVQQASSAKDVEALCEHLKINPSNPLQYMSQEDMKSFTQASPEQLYDYLSMGTGMDEFARDLASGRAKILEMTQGIKVREKEVSKLRDRHDLAKKDAETIQSITDNDEILNQARHAAAWAEVVAMDASMSDTRENVDRLVRVKARLEGAVIKAEAQVVSLQEKILAVKTRKRELAESREAAERRVEELQANYQSNFKERIDELAGKLSTEQTRIARSQRQQAKAQAKMDKFKTSLRSMPGQEEVTAAEDARERAATRAAELRIEMTKKQAAKTDERLQESKEKLESSRMAYLGAKKAAENAASALTLLKRSAGHQVTVAPGIRVPTSKLATVNHHTVAVRALLDKNAHLFSQPIMGPIGATLTPRPGTESLFPAVEAAMSRVMNMYVAANHQDCMRAMHLCKSRHVPHPPTFTAPPTVPESERARFAATSKAVPHCKSLFDVIDSDKLPWRVMVTIVDSLALHKMLFTDRTLTHPHFAADTSKAHQLTVYAHDGAALRYSPLTKSQSRTPAPDGDRGSVMGSSDASRLAEQEREAAKKASDYEASKTLWEADADAHKVEDAMHRKLSQAFETARTKWKTATGVVDRLEAELSKVRDAVAGADEASDGLQRDIEECEITIKGEERLQADSEAQARALRARIEDVKREAAPLLEDITKASEEAMERAGVGVLDEELEALEDKVRSTNASIKQLRTKSIKDKQDELEIARASLAKNEELIGPLRTAVQAGSGMLEPPAAALAGVDATAAEVQRVEQAGLDGIEKLKALGLNYEQIRADVVASRDALNAAETQVTNLREALVLLKKHMKSTQKTKADIINKIEGKAIERFAEVLSSRGHEGELLFAEREDGQRQCNVSVTAQVMTQGNDQAATQDGMYNEDEEYAEKDDKKAENAKMDLGALSGGEKSLTAVSLLLAFGAAGLSPWRMFDEFDVFMDEANRKLAMESLGRYGPGSGKQLICLTPLGIAGVVKESADVAIRHISAPVRGLVADPGGAAAAASSSSSSSSASASASASAAAV